MAVIIKVLFLYPLTTQATCEGQGLCTDDKTSLLQVENTVTPRGKRAQAPHHQAPHHPHFHASNAAHGQHRNVELAAVGTAHGHALPYKATSRAIQLDVARESARLAASATHTATQAQAAVLAQTEQQPPIRAASGVIPGPAGYTALEINVFPDEIAFPGPMLAPPPLKPDYEKVDPNDKVALAQKDLEWAKATNTAVSMMAAQADMAGSIASRDEAWANEENEQAIDAYDELKESGTATPEQLQEAEERIKLASKDMDWASAESTAALEMKGKGMMAKAVTLRDTAWAQAELKAAKKAKHTGDEEEEEAEEAAEIQIKEEEEAQGIYRDEGLKDLGHPGA